MLLHCVILLFLRHSTVESWSSLAPATTRNPTVTAVTAALASTTAAAEEMLHPLQLIAVPDYPVAAGQRVDLHCYSINSTSSSVVWSWQRLQKENWTVVASGQNLTLSEPRQSGRYRCLARLGWSQERESSQHSVLIISMPASADGAVGIAALFLSILALVLSLATSLLLCLQKQGPELSALNTALKGFPKAKSSAEGAFPKNDSEGGIYINYGDNNPAYSDLNPSNMTVDNVYSSLS